MSFVIMFLKKVIKLLFNRIFYVVLAMLLQLIWLFLLVWKLAEYSKYISLAIAVISVISVLWILNKRINPSYKLGWTMLIMAFPVFGLLLYMLFGQSRIADHMQIQYEKIRKESLPYLQSDPEIYEKIEAEDPSAAVQSEYICHLSAFPAHEHTEAEYFQVGDDMFPVLVRELEQAE
ncbi:PLD nuclease N-terminal domain-containing protein, partial [uncultured Blautia sp.]